MLFSRQPTPEGIAFHVTMPDKRDVETVQFYFESLGLPLDATIGPVETELRIGWSRQKYWLYGAMVSDPAAVLMIQSRFNWVSLTTLEAQNPESEPPVGAAPAKKPLQPFMPSPVAVAWKRIREALRATRTP